MKATTSIALIAAWIWIFQGCDTKGHRDNRILGSKTAEQTDAFVCHNTFNEHLAIAICNR